MTMMMTDIVKRIFEPETTIKILHFLTQEYRIVFLGHEITTTVERGCLETQEPSPDLVPLYMIFDNARPRSYRSWFNMAVANENMDRDMTLKDIMIGDPTTHKNPEWRRLSSGVRSGYVCYVYIPGYTHMVDPHILVGDEQLHDICPDMRTIQYSCLGGDGTHLMGRVNTNKWTGASRCSGYEIDVRVETRLSNQTLHAVLSLPVSEEPGSTAKLMF
jgi:hypothetical protein